MVKFFEKDNQYEKVTGVFGMNICDVEDKGTYKLFTLTLETGQEQTILMFQQDYMPLVKILSGRKENKIVEWDSDEIMFKSFEAEIYLEKGKDGKERQKLKNIKYIPDTKKKEKTDDIPF